MYKRAYVCLCCFSSALNALNAYRCSSCSMFPNHSSSLRIQVAKSIQQLWCWDLRPWVRRCSPFAAFVVAKFYGCHVYFFFLPWLLKGFAHISPIPLLIRFFLGCTGNNRYLSIPCPIIFGDDKPHTSWYWLTHSCFEVIQGPVPYSIKAKAAPPHVDSLPLDLHSSKSMAVGVLTEDGPVSRVHRVPHIQRPSWRQRPHAETARNAAGLKLQKHFY